MMRLAVPYQAAYRVIEAEVEAVGSEYNWTVDEGIGRPVLRSYCSSSLHHPGH